VTLSGVITGSEGDLLTSIEVARRLGVTPVTVRRWVASGALPAVRLGPGPLARMRVDVVELERFVRPAGAPEHS
jgi:excisionase family DNA binding protein